MTRKILNDNKLNVPAWSRSALGNLHHLYFHLISNGLTDVRQGLFYERDPYGYLF